MNLAHDPAGLEALLAQRPLRRLLEVLNPEGEETRVVGGAVRNALLGRPVTEIDLATTADPETTSVTALSADLKVIPTGIDHGTVTVVVEGTPFEVTTLREDIETFGRRAKVRFGRDFAADACRRDFTMNALFLGADGRLHDYVGGLADLAAGRVAFIGDPAARIREDYLRILRFFRFHAEYGAGEPDSAGLLASIRGRAGLALLSRERVRAEFLKLLVTRRAVEMVALLSETGFLQPLIAGIGWISRLTRVTEAEAGREPDAVRRLAALSVAVLEDAERLRDRLRLSNREHERLLAFAKALVALRSREAAVDGGAIRRAVAEHGLGAVKDVLLAVAGEARPALAPEAWDLLRRLADGREPAPAFPLRGADFLERGITEGRRIGRLLAQAREAWLSDGCPLGEAVRQSLIDRSLASERAT